MSTPGLTLFRLSNALLGRLAPASTARRVSRIFTTPQLRPMRPWEEEVEQGAQRIKLATGLSGLHWPGNGPRVLALHGWEGRATQFGPLAQALAELNADVTALDGPAHGQSVGTRAHPIAFARALLDADRELGPYDIVIGHSMGAASAALAKAWGLRASMLVMLAGPSSLPNVLGRFTEYINLPNSASERFMNELQAIAGVTPETVDVDRYRDRLTIPALVVHDTGDLEVPVEEGRRNAAVLPQARYLETTGLGHNRILRDPQVLNEVVTFVSGDRPLTSTAADQAAARSHRGN